MTARASYNFHLPLPPELHEMLREEAQHSGQPATTLAREALANWLRQRRKRRLYAEVAAYAAESVGTRFDLDEDLEAAALEAMSDEEPA